VGVTGRVVVKRILSILFRRNIVSTSAVVLPHVHWVEELPVNAFGVDMFTKPLRSTARGSLKLTVNLPELKEASYSAVRLSTGTDPLGEIEKTKVVGLCFLEQDVLQPASELIHIAECAGKAEKLGPNTSPAGVSGALISQKIMIS
jgi:hypothetical protein